MSVRISRSTQLNQKVFSAIRKWKIHNIKIKPEPASLVASILIFISSLVLSVAYNPSPTALSTRAGLCVLAAIGQTLVATWSSRRVKLTSLSTRLVVAVACAAACLLSVTSVAVWPNSSDEYDYLYMARTFLHARLWNTPAPVADLFDFFWIYDKDGIRVSQYPPGWSAVLMPFVDTGTQAFASPLAILATGILLIACLRRLGVSPSASASLSALMLLTPFALLNAASLFPMSYASALVLAVCWLQLRDDDAPAASNRAAIGLCFALLLSTRYEVFAILVVSYIIERVWRRRWHVFSDLPAFFVGWLPVTIALLAYNWKITGSPFETTISWLRPTYGLGLDAMGDLHRHSLTQAMTNERVWFALFCEFGGFALLVFYFISFYQKVVARILRFYDALPFLAVGVFFLFPELGGHQFGPRYWLFAFAPMVLTAGVLPIDDTGWLRLKALRLHLPTFALWHVLGYAVMTVCVAITYRTYVDIRRQIYLPLPASVPALVLVPSRTLITRHFQLEPDWAQTRDFTRNGTDFNAVVLYGREDVPRAYELACSMRGRAVYVWRGPTRLVPVRCVGARSLPVDQDGDTGSNSP